MATGAIKAPKYQSQTLSTSNFVSTYVSAVYDAGVENTSGVTTFSGLVELKTSAISASTTYTIGTIPSGYRPKRTIRAICQTMNANWNSPGALGTSVAVYIGTDGAIQINRGSNNLTTGSVIFNLSWQSDS